MSIYFASFVSSLIAYKLVHRNKIFSLGLVCLLNKSKTKVQTRLLYKQTNMNKLFMNNTIHLLSQTQVIYERHSSFIALSRNRGLTGTNFLEK